MTPIEHTLADGEIGIDYGVTTLPHLRDLSIGGPDRVTGVSDTESRRRIFRCRPTSADEELPCAEEILKDLATRAYRRPRRRVRSRSSPVLLRHRPRGTGFRERNPHGAPGDPCRARASFSGSSAMPEDAAPGESYPVSDLDLASRLSFFLWASAPDEELLALASEGTLSDPRRSRSDRCGGCSPIPARRRSPRASPRSGCACRTWRSSTRTRSAILITTRRSRRR